MTRSPDRGPYWHEPLQQAHLLCDLTDTAERLAFERTPLPDGTTIYRWRASAAAGEIRCILPNASDSTASLTLESPSRKLHEAFGIQSLHCPWAFDTLAINISAPCSNRGNDENIIVGTFTYTPTPDHTSHSRVEMRYDQLAKLLADGGFHEKASAAQRIGRGALTAVTWWCRQMVYFNPYGHTPPPPFMQ